MEDFEFDKFSAPLTEEQKIKREKFLNDYLNTEERNPILCEVQQYGIR